MFRCLLRTATPIHYHNDNNSNNNTGINNQVNLIRALAEIPRISHSLTHVKVGGTLSLRIRGNRMMMIINQHHEVDEGTTNCYNASDNKSD